MNCSTGSFVNFFFFLLELIMSSIVPMLTISTSPLRAMMSFICSLLFVLRIMMMSMMITSASKQKF